MVLQVAALRADKPDSLGFEQRALDLRRPERPAAAQAPFGVDDAVRGDVVGALMHRPPDPPGGANVPEHSRYRAVGRDAAGRHPAHHLVHLLLERGHAAVYRRHAAASGWPADGWLDGPECRIVCL